MRGGTYTRKQLNELKKSKKTFLQITKSGKKGYYIWGERFRVSDLSFGQARIFGVKKITHSRAIGIRKAYVERKIKKYIPEEDLDVFLKRAVEEIEELPEEPVKERKAYIVWYGGKNYSTRYEIYVEFWAKDSENPDALGKALLRRAIPMIFADITMDTVKSWHGADIGYEVTGAESGRIATHINKTVRAVYSMKGRDTKIMTFERA